MVDLEDTGMNNVNEIFQLIKPFIMLRNMLSMHLLLPGFKIFKYIVFIYSPYTFLIVSFCVSNVFPKTEY